MAEFTERERGGLLIPATTNFALRAASTMPSFRPSAFWLSAQAAMRCFQAVRRAFVDQAGVVGRSDYFMRGEDEGHLVLAMVFRSDFELSEYFELSDRFRGPPSSGFGCDLLLSGKRWFSGRKQCERLWAEI